jgi:three-Cys-motif partner protein
MPHKADNTFFKAKRPWSEQKDLVLGYYLKPYLAKIKTLNKPVCIVDGFAGRGEFEDKKPGSPLIICRSIEQARRSHFGGATSAVFIEADAELFKFLSNRIQSFGFASVANSKFLDQVSALQSKAKTHSVFLYLDPYTVEGLEWQAIDDILRYVQAGQSIELLLNFNVDSFARRALAALSRSQPLQSDELPEPEWEIESRPEFATLDRIVGGDWWRSIAMLDQPYPQLVSSFTAEFCRRLRERFAEVCFYEVRERWHHKVPKYVLVFGSRHPDALELMNEAMGNARSQFATESAVPGMLFETLPESLVSDQTKLPGLILAEATGSMTRKALRLKVIRRQFCMWRASEINKAIGSLIADGKLVSATGKFRINDTTAVSRA